MSKHRRRINNNDEWFPDWEISKLQDQLQARGGTVLPTATKADLVQQLFAARGSIGSVVQRAVSVGAGGSSSRLTRSRVRTLAKALSGKLVYLSTDLIIYITSFLHLNELPCLALVNRFLRARVSLRLSGVPSPALVGLQSLSVSFYNKWLTVDRLIALLSRTVGLKFLRLHSFFAAAPLDLNVTAVVRSLQTVVVQDVQETAAVVVLCALAPCRHLVELEISCLAQPSTKAERASYVSVFSSVPWASLRRLTLSETAMLDVEIKHLVAACPGVRELRYIERNLRLIQDCFQQLELLDLRGLGQELVAPVTSFPVGSSRVDLQACKLEYSIVSPK